MASANKKPAGGTESGYNSDKGNNGASPTVEVDNNVAMSVDDSGVPSPTVGMLSVSPDTPEEANAAPAGDMNIEMGSPVCGHNSPNDEEITERPESRLSFVVNQNKSADLKTDFSRLSLLNDGENKIEGAYGGDEDEKVGESFLSL